MRIKNTLVMGFFLFLTTLTKAQTPPSSPPLQQSATSAQSPGITTLLKKTVGFLRVGYLKEGKPVEADGTCFFVFYEDKRLGENKGFAYLVTNRHMAQPGVEEGIMYPIISTSLRLNLKTPEKGSIEAALPSGGQSHWFFPDDDSVDLAVFPLAPDQGTFDIEAFPVSQFATRDVVQKEGIAEGDSILFTGYFYQFPGLTKFQPIIREGVLAMMPDEMLETTLRKPGQLYLGDVHVFGGNSGSPLFVNIGGMRNGQFTLMQQQYRLLGIVSGFYHEDSNLNLTIAATITGRLEQNSGIALVVPVDELKKLLDSPDLQAGRDSLVSATKPKN